MPKPPTSSEERLCTSKHSGTSEYKRIDPRVYHAGQSRRGRNNAGNVISCKMFYIVLNSTGRIFLDQNVTSNNSNSLSRASYTCRLLGLDTRKRNSFTAMEFNKGKIDGLRQRWRNITGKGGMLVNYITVGRGREKARRRSEIVSAV
jgi:hypothetical protein